MRRLNGIEDLRVFLRIIRLTPVVGPAPGKLG
jgi:hypothetical protein